MSLDTGDAAAAIMAQVLIVYAVAIVMDNRCLTPRILGRHGAASRHGAAGPLRLGSLMGLLGMILACPLPAVLIAYLKRYVLEPAPQGRHDQWTGLNSPSVLARDRPPVPGEGMPTTPRWRAIAPPLHRG
ncbi:MAG: hypothetical protein R2810_04995 [Flavobacteriales bacterium]